MLWNQIFRLRFVRNGQEDVENSVMHSDATSLRRNWKLDKKTLKFKFHRYETFPATHLRLYKVYNFEKAHYRPRIQ